MLSDLFSAKSRAPAECVLYLGGEEIVDLYASLVEVLVDLDRTQAGEATLVFETRRFEDGTWTVQDDDRFRPWTEVKIEAVFGATREEVMRGRVRQLKAEYPAEKGRAKVTVTCQDESLLLDREHINQAWGSDSPTTDGAIATEIIQRHDMGFIAPPATGQTNVVANQNATDIRFLRERADANGYELIFRDGKVHFGPMRLDAERQDTILVYAGTDTNCVSFDIQDDGHMPDKVAFQVAAETGVQSNLHTVEPDLPRLGPEPADSSAAGLGDFVWRPTGEGDSDETRMTARAQRMANEQSMKIKVEGELDGTLYGHVLRVGEPVGVDGVGARYGGTYYVDTATHRFSVEGYRTTFRLLRNAYGDDLNGAANPLASVL